eukprot:CAMPEP_0204823902 /NCGR_PEP_ID=MMETSP1346-20131115/1980_1 /ASSEMBLY_ACC=CAM_ASM_000771 /TAXON_ID=215587 /ORGANISM="Aplanochytrium stocchinoi, Strain GSBS06" /LENGTH=478 /DNA_ID=CAMNT_0051950777 /DNA_START=61 /DNA_END=1500 /DNA_ORIENTATION=+
MSNSSNVTFIVNETVIAEFVAAAIGEKVAYSAATNVWVLIAGFLVFFMHAGFAMLETGSVRNQNKVNILFKNIGTVTIGGLMYYLIGYALAYGSQDDGFIGGDSGFFAGKSLETYGDGSQHTAFFFQFAFCVTAATIVSGAVAGRIALEAYFLIAAYLTAFVYPVVSHWVWGTSGFLSAFAGENGTFIFEDSYPFACGVFDYAGSGVVHMTGGVAALIAAYILGPRAGRFGEDAKPMPGHNLAMATLGTLILWFGWYGFNCGSTLLFDGLNASKVAVTTSLAPASACLASIFIQKKRTGKYDLPAALNAILGGLVSITAGCSVVEDWAAIPIGVIGAFVYQFAADTLVKLEIDDPIGAFPVHGACGAWGVIAVAIFGSPRYVQLAYSCNNPPPSSGNYWDPLPGYQFAIQLILVLTIIGWVTLTVTPFVFVLKKLKVLRVSEEMELAGLDASEHFAKSSPGGVVVVEPKTTEAESIES